LPPTGNLDLSASSLEQASDATTVDGLFLRLAAAPSFSNDPGIYTTPAILLRCADCETVPAGVLAASLLAIGLKGQSAATSSWLSVGAIRRCPSRP
jgi:hypothetical protein